MDINELTYAINGAIFEVNRVDKIHEAQLMNYLKATGVPVGLLVNFKYPNWIFDIAFRPNRINCTSTYPDIERLL
jgi:hypothetical protein